MATQFDFSNIGSMFGGGMGGTPTGLDALLSEDQRKLMGRNAALAAAAALLQAGGRSTTPINLGQALGSALQAGQQGYQQARAGSVQDLLLNQKLEEAKRAEQLRKQIADVMTTAPQPLNTAQAALAAPGMPLGPTIQRAELMDSMPQPTANELKANQYLTIADIYAAQGKSEDAKRYQEIAERLNPRPEVTGQPFEVTDATGKPLLVQQMKSGALQTLQGFGPKREVVLQSLGGRTVAINKSALKGGESFETTMTPAEVASNIIAQGTLNVAKGGLGLRQAEFNRGAFDRVETPEGFVNIPKAGGPAVPIMGPGGTQLKGVSGGRPTEGETNAAGFAQRMELAQGIFDKLPAGSQPGAGTRTLEAVPFVGGAMARQFAQDANTQMYDQAAQDWIRAKLRKESGAAIGVDEARQEYATYFPMVGDTAEKIAQKAEARRVVTLGMQKAAGKAYTPYVAPVQPGQLRPTDIQNIIDSYNRSR
jgi:hypothetical protein